MALANLLTTDEQIDALLERAKHQPDRPIAKSARYDAGLDAIIVELTGGRRLLLPRTELQGLDQASVSQLSEIELHVGSGHSWPQLDVDHYLPSLLAGQYGSIAWMRALEMRGMPHTAENSAVAFAKDKVFHNLYPLTAPFGSVYRQVLQGVSMCLRDGLATEIALAFPSNTVRIAALRGDVDVDLSTTGSIGSDISDSNPWQRCIGRQIEDHWFAMDQNGNLNVLLLSFSGATSPEISLTAIDSHIQVSSISH
jgi:hypothetical protein